MITQRKKAFTLVELIIVIVVLAILIAGLSFFGNGSVERTRRTTTESFLRIIANDMETAYDDYGPYRVMSGLTTDEQKEKIDDFCAFLDEEYLHTDLADVDTTNIHSHGFVVETIETDPWGTPYMLYYVTAEDYEGDFFVASAGPDMKFSDRTYSEGKFGDDIVISGTMKR